MSYTPTIWKAGDLVTSAKLNKLEQGVANGINLEVINMEANMTQGSYSLDKTAGEIIDILKSGKNILVICTMEPPAGISSEAYTYLSAIPTGVSYMPEQGFQILLDLPMLTTNSNGSFTLTASGLDQYPSYNA